MVDVFIIRSWTGDYLYNWKISSASDDSFLSSYQNFIFPFLKRMHDSSPTRIAARWCQDFDLIFFFLFTLFLKRFIAYQNNFKREKFTDVKHAF